MMLNAMGEMFIKIYLNIKVPSVSRQSYYSNKTYLSF